MAKIKIENVVASTSLGEALDLQAIALALCGAEYEPEQFPGLIYRLKEPKTATLLFRSGKVVCTGAKSLEHVKMAIDIVAKQIEAAGIPIKKNPEIEVQNIVASSDLGAQINLNAIAISLGLEKVEYEPEQFPGLVYRIDVPKVVVLLFGSGKMVCTGAKSIDAVGKAVDIVTAKIEASGVKVDRNPEITVQNIVASSDLGAALNLNAIGIGLGLENVEYEPEQFPGLVYRIDVPKVVVLLFGSGKLVCTGARKPSDIEQAVEKITAELKAAGLLR